MLPFTGSGFPAEAGFWVREKDKIEDPTPTKKMPVLSHNCQWAANFQIGNDETGSFLSKYASKVEFGDKNGTLNFWTLNFWTFEPMNLWTFKPMNGYNPDRMGTIYQNGPESREQGGLYACGT